MSLASQASRRKRLGRSAEGSCASVDLWDRPSGEWCIFAGDKAELEATRAEGGRRFAGSCKCDPLAASG